MNHLPKVLVVAPHTTARARGLVNELHVGWRHNFNNTVSWWGAISDDSQIEPLLANARAHYGDHITLELRETDR